MSTKSCNPRRSDRSHAVVSLAVLAVTTGWGMSTAQAQLVVDGYTQSTFGTVSPGLFGGAYNQTYVDANGNTRFNAGVEVGEGSYDPRNFILWAFDGQNRRHGNLYEMYSKDFAGISTGQAFNIADLRYFNAEIFATSSSTFNLPVGVKVNLTNLLDSNGNAVAPTFNFNFRLTFTVNRPGPVDDTLEFVNAASAETFAYGNKTYAMRLKGFSNDIGQTYASVFQLPEWGTVNSSLFAEFEEVLGPRLFVNPGDRLVFQARVGTTATRTLLVQNSGAAGSILTGTIQGAPVGDKFGPSNDVPYALAVGQTVTRDYTYTPTGRSGGTLDFRTLNILSNEAGIEDVVLTGQGVGPVYTSLPQPGGTIALGRVMSGGGNGLLPISNTSSDGDLAELTDLTLRSLTFGGADASTFRLSGITPGQILQAGGAGASAQIGTNVGSRGVKAATLTVDTDVNVALGADGRDYGYNVTATVVEKRPLASTPVTFNRMMVDHLRTGLTTRLSGGVTPDNFYTNPILRATGAAAGGVTIAADSVGDRTFNTNTGATISTRTVQGRFTTSGEKSGNIALTVAAEANLTGQGSYSLSVPYTATAVRKRELNATPVNFGRVVAGQSLGGFTSTISSPQTVDNFYTFPTLMATGAALNGVLVGSDPTNRVFNLNDGSIFSTRGVSATFATPGAYSGIVPLNVTAEGLAGEGTYAVGVAYTADVIGQRLVSATPVAFGRVMVDGPAPARSTSISSPVTPNNLLTNPILRSTGATDGVATVSADTQDRLFNRADGQPISVRPVGIQFATSGQFNGSIPLVVAKEGLAGEADYALNVDYSATAVRKRDTVASTVDFGRIIVGQTVTGLSTGISAPITGNNFYTNPVLGTTGGSDPRVSVSTGATEATFNQSNGSTIASRGVSGTFPQAGNFIGSIPLSVRAEGLVGEGTYSLSVPYVVEAVRQRQVQATPVNFGRVVAGGTVSGFQTQISSPATVDDLYTRPVLAASGATVLPVTVGADTEARTFDRQDGSTLSTRNVSAAFTAPGPQSGSVPLVITPEGLAGEGNYTVGVDWNANVVLDRQISATPVNFGRVFTGVSVNRTSNLSTTGNDDTYTRVRLNAGSYTQGPVGTTLTQTRLFDGPEDTSSASLAASFSTPGAVNTTTSLTTTNGAVTGEGLAGENPQPVSINYLADVYSRGLPSFTPNTQTTVYNLNFGTVPRAAGTRTVPFSFFNVLSSLNTADLEFDGIVGATGNTTRLATNLSSPFTGFNAGSESAWTATIDTSAVGTYSATYQLTFHDERSINGAAQSSTLTLNLTGTIAGANSQPPRTDVYIFNPGFESLTPDLATRVDIPLNPGERTLGMSSTFIDNENFDPRFVPAWRTSNELDGRSGVVSPNTGAYPADSFGGNHVAYVNGDTFRQLAVGTFNAEDLYDFSFKIARPVGSNPNTWFAPQVGIFLGSTLFQPLTTDQPLPDVGEWVTWRSQYRIDPTNPLFGLPITLRVTGDARTPVLFDDFLLFIPGDEGAASSVISTWNHAFGGSWNESNKWTNGVPNGVGGEARLLGSIVTPARIALDTPVTLGKLSFENTRAYNISGPGTLRLHGNGTGAHVHVKGGSHQISADVSTGSNVLLEIDGVNQLVMTGRLDNTAGHVLTKSGPGSLFIDGAQKHGVGAGLVSVSGSVYLQTNAGTGAGPNLNLGASGTGLISLNADQDVNSIDIGNGGVIRLEEGGKLITTRSVAIGQSGLLDITDGAMVVDYTGSSTPFEQILSQVRAAANFENGYWDGPGGITSSLVGQSLTYGIAVVDNELSVIGSPGFYLFDSSTPFDGRIISPDSVLVKYALVGDSSLDGLVNDDDLFLFLASYTDTQTGSWLTGDYTYDGLVNDDDLFLMLPNYLNGTSISSASGAATVQIFESMSLMYGEGRTVSVPEPSSVLILGLAGLGLLKRRRRIHRVVNS